MAQLAHHPAVFHFCKSEKTGVVENYAGVERTAGFEVGLVGAATSKGVRA
jgi:hypothetical protein